MLLACLLLEHSGASTRAAYQVVPIDAVNAGSVSGMVRFASGEPQQDTFLVNRDREVCGPEMRTVDWVRISGGRLLDVVVFEVNQKGCQFAPLVQVLQDGGALVLTNQDPILHNAQAYEIIHSARRKIMNVVPRRRAPNRW